jgi:hypothetical protein
MLGMEGIKIFKVSNVKHRVINRGRIFRCWFGWRAEK